MKTMKTMNIYDITSVTENDIKSIATEHLVIKDHDIYLIDMGGAFGYSAVVYYDGQQIHHANDYALHHPGKTLKELRQIYIAALEAKLYSDDELSEPIRSYADYKSRCNYLINLYSQRKPYVSGFYIGGKAPNTSGMIYDEVSFAWYAVEYRDFVNEHETLWHLTQGLWDCAWSDEAILTEAFESEMWNHEYYINWSGDVEVLAALGFNGFGSLTDMQRRAYSKARDRYLTHCGEY